MQRRRANRKYNAKQSHASDGKNENTNGNFHPGILSLYMYIIGYSYHQRIFTCDMNLLLVKGDDVAATQQMQIDIWDVLQVSILSF
jgi:hypothetical protein